MAEPVVGGALLLVLQDFVSFAAILEFRFGLGIARIAVGVILHGHLAIGLLDLLRRGTLRQAEKFVIVLLRHQAASPCL